MGAVILRDSFGNPVPPGVAGGTPVLASGVKLTDAAAGADHTQTLVAGGTYKIMADTTSGGQWLFGIATTDTAANVVWFCPVGGVIALTMPPGYATLHYQCLANGGSCYIARMAGGGTAQE